MKKIFTLFMATVVAISMMALPQNLNMAGKKAKPASQEQFVAKNSVQAKSLEMAKEQMLQRDFKRADVAKKQLPAPVAATAKKVATQTAGETIELHFDGFSVEPEYSEEYQEWYMACAQDGWIVRFDYYSEELYGTFTTEDFEMYYSYMYDPYGEWIDYVDITMTISENYVNEYLTEILLDAMILGTDDNTYHVTCKHNVFTPKAQIDLGVVADATLTYDDVEGVFVINGANEQVELELNVNATWPIGRFTKGEFNLDQTKVVSNGVDEELLSAELTITTAKNDANVPCYYAEFSYYNQDTVLNNVVVWAPIPEPTETVEIEINNLSVDDSWAAYMGWVYVLGANAEYEIEAGVAALEAAEGTYTGEDVMVYVIDMATGGNVENVYAEVTMTYDEELGWVAYIEALCTDGKLYKINMKYEIPTPTKTVTLHFETCAQASFYPDLQNDLYLANGADGYFVSLDIYNVPFGGEFTLDNMDTYYTQIYDSVNDVLVNIADVHGTIDQINDTTIMKAQVIGFDAVLYDIVLWYAVPTPTHVVEFDVEAEFVNALDESGYYQLAGFSPDGAYYVALAPVTSEIAGTYGNDGLFAKFGAEGGYHDFYGNETYLAKVDPETQEVLYYASVDKGTMVVEMDENNNITAEVSIICSDAVQYNITMTSVYDVPHLEYDAEEGDVDHVYTAADQLELYDYVADYGEIDMYVTSADNSTMFSMIFYVYETDPDIMIPVGTYNIEDTYDYFTVQSSPGVSNGTVYPSFFASNMVYDEMEDTWYLSTPIHFIVNGTVEVSKNEDATLHIEVNAVNSYGVAIHVVYDGSTTSIENVNVEDVVGVKKMVQDGQLYIIRDGKAFNMMGAQVK